MQKTYRLQIEELVNIQVINPTFVVRKSDISKMRNLVAKDGSHKFHVRKATYYYAALCAKKVMFGEDYESD